MIDRECRASRPTGTAALLGAACLLVAAVCAGAPTDNADRTTGCVNVMDHVIRVGKADHTEALQQAFAAARELHRDPVRGKWRIGVVYFPPGTYRIHDTIDISGCSEVFGHGASIEQQAPDKDIFFSGSTRLIDIHGLSFHGGRDQIALGNHNIANGFLKIRDCHFWNAGRFAVHALYRFPGDTQSSYLLVERCWFRECHQVLHTVSDYSALRDCWIRAVDRSDMPPAEQNKAMIEHRRGNLLCQDILGVPNVSAPDLRWIDNYAALTCRRFRFGGEGAGHTPVVHKARGGKVIIEDSVICALGNNRRPCAVYCEEMPDRLAVDDSWGTYDHVVMLDEAIEPAAYYADTPRVVVPKVSIPGPLPTRLAALLAAAEKRAAGGVDWGEHQLDDAATRNALETAVAAAAGLPATPPGEMRLRSGAQGHRQRTDPADYIDITPSTHSWDLTENMDGSDIPCSEFIAVAEAGDDIVLLNRTEDTRYPHIRIRNVSVNLDRTPILSWRMKDNGLAGGSHTIKLIDTETGEMWSPSKKIFGPHVFDYLAWDLREIMNRRGGQTTLDLKFYLMGGRRNDIGKQVVMSKGDYFVLDFLRLEALGDMQQDGKP